jgi:hypothetical protein
MRESVSFVRPGLLLFGIAGIIALSGVAPAEQIGVVKELDTNWKKEYKESGEFLKAGTEVKDKKQAEKFAKALAQYHTYRITHRNLDAHKVQKDLGDIIAISKNAEFNRILGPKLVEAMKETLALQQDSKKDAIDIVNAAIMLPAMARLKQDDVGVYLVELVNGKDTHDVVRLYALKALKEYMPIKVQQSKDELELKDAKQNAQRARDQKHVDPLTKYIEGPVRGGWLTHVKTGWLSPGEVEGMRFLRREAIISLAHAGSPAVLAVPQKKAPDGMVAPTLLKVLVKGELQPPPSLQEKVEAAIGLLNMDYKNMPEYNPDVATYLIGKTVLEFATEYNTDSTNFTSGKKLPKIPWKANARRLMGGLEKHAKNADTNSAKALRTYGEPLLKKIDEYKDANVNQFSEQVEKWRPKDGKVFKTLTAPEIRLAPAVVDGD